MRSRQVSKSRGPADELAETGIKKGSSGPEGARKEIEWDIPGKNRARSHLGEGNPMEVKTRELNAQKRPQDSSRTSPMKAAVHHW